MAITRTRVGVPVADANKRRVVYDLTFDSSYPDDGESLTPSDVGLRVIEEAIPHGPFMDAGNDNGIVVRHDNSENKLVAFWQTDPADAGGADVALVEVAATTDLSGYSGRFTFRGW